MELLTQITRKSPLVFLVMLVAGLMGLSSVVQADQMIRPTLSKSELSSSGQDEAVLDIAKFGRYAIIGESEQRFRMSLVDRMVGPRTVSGKRTDRFLEKGDYKIITRGSKDNNKPITLKVVPFAEMSRPVPSLVRHKLVTAELNDFEQRSFWVKLDEAQQFNLRAAGRSLHTVGIWHEGKWLEDIRVQRNQTIVPKTGEPMRDVHVTGRLGKGLYLVTLYGGQPKKWANGEPERNLVHLQWGVPKLDPATREHRIASPFGEDRFRVSGWVDHVRLELPRAEDAVLRAGSYDDRRPYHNPYTIATMDKKARVPAISIKLGKHSGEDVIVVRREAGKPYVLESFFYAWNWPVRFEETGHYWIGGLQAGDAADNIDSTGVLTRDARSRKESRVLVAHSAIPLRRDSNWRRKFNLHDKTSVHVEIKQRGKYTITAHGDVLPRITIEPFFASSRSKVKPKSVRSGDPVVLNAGFYVLFMYPQKDNKGISDISIAGDRKKTAVATQSAGIRFTQVKLDERHTYSLHMNYQPDVVKGLVVRKLPIALEEESLPISMLPGEIVPVEVKTKSPGQITVKAESGQYFAVSYNKDTLDKTLVAAKEGRNTIYVKNISDRVQMATLKFTETELQRSEPLPAFDAKQLEQLPKFDVLKAEKPSLIQLDRDSAKHYLLKVEKPALYRIESAGLLHTQGKIRTRTVTALSQGDANGVGRNFLVQSYLRSGDYQVSVKTRGQTKGHMAVRLNRTDLHKGGALTNDVWARTTLKAGQALEYFFTPSVNGRYELTVDGLERYFTYRLEDGQGWPLTASRSGTQRFDLRAGEQYRLIVLPGAIDARVATRFMHEPKVAETTGHGPHPLVLNTSDKHVWNEPKEGEERKPDIWTFTLHAKMPISIRLNNGMVGKILRKDGSEAGVVSALNHFSGSLDAGEYEVQVKSFRPNAMVDYRISLNTTYLVPGERRRIYGASSLRFSVGQEGLVELASYGRSDLRATLYREGQAEPVASNDDRPDNWNFLIARNLTAGEYRLEVKTVGSSRRVSSYVQMYLPDAKQGRELAYGDSVTHEGSAQYIYPLAKANGDDVGMVSAISNSRIGLAVERKTDNGWHLVVADRGFKPRAEWQADGGDFRLRVWPLDRLGSEVKLSTSKAGAITAVSEEQLAKGVKSTAHGDVALLAINATQPGVFSTKDTGLRVNYNGVGLQAADPGLVSVLHSKPILVSTVKPSFVTAERVLLGSTRFKQVQLDVPPQQAVHLDLDTGAFGPRLIVAESRLGQPGLILEGVGGGLSQNMGVAQNSAAALALTPANSSVRIVSAENFSLPVGLRQVSFPAPQDMTLQWGTNDFSLEANKAYRFILPAGSSMKHINLPAGSAAVLQSEGLAVATLWSGEQALSESSDQVGDELYVVSEKGGQASANFLPRAQNATVLTMQLPYQRTYSARGSTQVAVRLGLNEENKQLKLRAFGAVEALTFIADDGSVQRGREVTLNLGGTAVLSHDVGSVLLVLQGGKLRFDAVEALTPPIEIQLAGPNQDLAFAPSVPKLLHIRSEAPAVALIERDGAEQVEVFAQGVNLYTYIPAEKTTVRLLPLTGASLNGSAQVLWLDAVRIKDGLGDAYQLSAGQARLFHFTTTRKAKVGVGVNASSDVVTSRLYDAKGNIVGTGVVQMHELEPGDYFMAIEVPADADLVTVRPAVVNLNPPDLGPPPEIRKQYQPR